ncbi:MAG: SDR family oxidoreductase [Sphingomonadaceae bacterium]|nr:SDR family oxidoreductase [Sphingomonadaceae bacterium]
MTDYTGKAALVTGAVSGLGLGIAKAFAGAGMRLALGYRKEGDREEAARWFGDAGHPDPLFVRLDVADRDNWAEVRDTIAAELGPLHILCNNAGVSVFGPMDEASYDDWDWIMAVNFGGIVNSLVTMLPGMQAHGEPGHVVNVASMAAHLAGPQAGIYTASKFAVRGLTESLRYNLAPTNLKVSLMCPGLIATNAYRSALSRPAEFGESGLGPADAATLDTLAPAFAHGMSIEEAGERLLAGMRRGDFWIFSHGEYEQDFDAIHDELVSALPPVDASPGRLEIERLRREANKLALERKISLTDLVE